MHANKLLIKYEYILHYGLGQDVIKEQILFSFFEKIGEKIKSMSEFLDYVKV
jgi:hypothetical protein